jgi:hypothetical protein
MACKVAENLPLQNLRHSLGLPFQCHSLRDHCAQGASRQLGDAALGGAGAAIGYCQALFNRAGTSDMQSRMVLEALSTINAPWSKSHELFWGYRHDETAACFLQNALEPLIGSGRVPVLISGLDPATEGDEIREIFCTQPALFPGESILLRLVLKGEDSIDATVSVINSLVTDALRSGQMPVWWPLLQAGFTLGQWARLRAALGDSWRFVNIAVNPFVDEAIIADLADQITVAQFVIGLSEGIHSNGNITLPSEMKIHGAPPEAAYNVFDYARTLQKANILPTCILLGPSAETWTFDQNVARVAKFLAVFREAANLLWEPIEPRNREVVWSLAA